MNFDWNYINYRQIKMTSWHGDAFHIIGPYEGSASHKWISPPPQVWWCRALVFSLVTIMWYHCNNYSIWTYTHNQPLSFYGHQDRDLLCSRRSWIRNMTRTHYRVALLGCHFLSYGSRGRCTCETKRQSQSLSEFWVINYPVKCGIK